MVTAGFLSSLSAPARRALESAGIQSLVQLATYSKKELLKLHGFGPASLPILEKCLLEEGLHFKEN